MKPEDAVARFRDYYDTFSPASADRVEELYAPAFEFADAFHEIRDDHTALKRYFAGIFDKLTETRFVVDDATVAADGSAYVRWHWDFRIWAGDPLRTVPGVTFLRFDDGGRIVLHRDYFDGAQVYEAFPVLGQVLRLIKSRL